MTKSFLKIPIIGGSLWEIIEKAHMQLMVGETISDEEWIEFCEQTCYDFQHKVRDMALAFWEKRGESDES